MRKEEIIEMVRQIQAGNEELMNDLFVESYYDIYKMAYKFCKNKPDANDIVQETFLELTKSIYDLRNPEIFYVWVHRIVKSKCIKMFRKEKYITMDDELLRNVSEMKETNVDRMPKEQLENKEDQEIIRELVKKLPEHYRIVVEMIYFDQLTMDEVQEYLNIPMGTVKSRLFTGKKKLKVMIKEFEKTEHRTIHFYDLGTVGVMSLFSWNALKQVIQERVAAASVQQVVTYTVIAVSCTSTAVLSVEAGTQIIEEYKQPEQVVQIDQQPVSKEVTNEEDTEPKLPTSDFSVMYHGQEITSEKDAYFIFIDWVDTTIEKTEEEKSEIKPIYDALQREQGVYWNLIQEQGYMI